MRATLEEIADVFSIGSAARTPSTILANVRNASRRSDCLSAIEREFTKTVREDDEEYEQCPLNWGSKPEQYIEQFRAALQASKVEPAPSNMDMRAAFEAWYAKPKLTNAKFPDGKYHDDLVNDAWIAWQAALSHTSPALVATPEILEAIGQTLAEAMEVAVSHGANSISMPDHLVAIAGWLSGIAPTQEQRVKAVAGLIVSVSQMSETNGNKWWSVWLSHGADDMPWDGHQVYTDAIEGRALYEAACLRHFLGQGPKPDILEFDTDHPPQATKQINGEVLTDEQDEFLSKSHTKAELWDRFVSLQTGDIQKLLKIIENLPQPTIQPHITRERLVELIGVGETYHRDNPYDTRTEYEISADHILAELQWRQ